MNRLTSLLRPFLIGLVHFLLFTSSGSGQQPYQVAKVIPPSPTASSLGVYGDFAVNYYNGRPDIKVPLYTIKTNNLSLDLKLSYDASGTKVAQDASWVGLGWALAAGGCITRTIRGLDDLLPYGTYTGYYNAGHLPPYTADNGYNVNSPTPADDLNFFEGMISGGQDGEPDIFTYNFAGRSGKMTLGKSVDGGLAFQANRDNLKIQFANNAFVITDADGVAYYFGTVENMDNYYSPISGAETPDDAPLSSLDLSPGLYRSTAAWYLDSIVSPTHETISFVYTTGQSLSLLGKGEQAFYQLTLSGGCEDGSTSGSGYMPSTLQQYSASRQLIYDVLLQKIIFRNGSVEFTTTNRDDIEAGPSGLSPQKLSVITVKNANGQVLKTQNLYYTYFDGDIGPTYARLKLDSVVEIGSDGTRKPPFSFQYFNPNNLPVKYTKAVDKWGYYNAQNDNQSLLPAMTITNPVNRQLNGSDRDQDVSGNLYPRDGVLSTMTYPTGGYSTFDYELNDYGNLDPEDQWIYQPASTYVSAGILGQNDLSNQSVNFTLTQTTSVTIFFNFSDNCMPTCQTNGIQGYTYAYLSQNGQSVGSWANSPGDEQDQVTLMLNAGTYTLTSGYVQNFTTTVGASWTNAIPVTSKQVPGIRIKEIKNYDATGNVRVKRFGYLNQFGGTTGRLIDKVKYDYYFQDNEGESGSATAPGGIPAGCSYAGYYVGLMSNSLFPVGFSYSGGEVGYDLVTEYDGENGENGRTEHYFYNNDVEFGDASLPSVPLTVDPLNGQEWTTLTYDAAGNMVSRVDRIFQINESATVKGLKVFAAPWVSPDNFMLQYYDNPSSWIVQSSERDVTYANADQDSLVTTKIFFYTNTDNKELTRATTTRSDGRLLVSKYKRADDYTGAGSSSFAAQMVAAHMISPVIEQQTFIQDANSTKLTAGQFMAYGQTNGFLKPSEVYRITGTAPNSDTTESSISASGQVTMHSAYEPEVYFDQYDGSGDLSQLHKIGGMDLAYIWDYNATYPIAEVKNAALQDVGYTSFEADGTGGISVNNPAGIVATDGITGNHCYSINNALSKANLDPTKTYVVSLWAKNGIPSYSGLNGSSQVVSNNNNWVQGKTINGWTYLEKTITGVTTINVAGGGGLVDEVRFYPSTAEMTTYTYTPLVGMSSACDAANRIMYYNYDPLSRLQYVTDQDGNIVKTYQYHYKGQ